MAALLLLLALALVVRAWRAGRRADPARVPGLLARFAIASVAASVLVPLATRASGTQLTLLAALAGIVSIVALDALVSLALWGPFRKRAIAIRAPFAIAAIAVALSGGALRVVGFLGAMALLSFRWRAALDTGGLFRTFLGAVALMAFFLSPLAPEPASVGQGPAATILRFSAIVVGILRIYALVGVFKTFATFTRDPSLGIRTVTRRLALSHVLVLVVPLALTVALWISTTYLGVNAERALAGRRLLAHEAAGVVDDLVTLTAHGDDAALLRLAEERDRRWPGARLWLDRGAGLVRVHGDSIRSEKHLGSWVARLDSLPDRGVVGLDVDRWLGGAVRLPDGRTAVLLAPVQAVIDSTLEPVLGATYSMILGSARDSAQADSLAALRDSLADTAEPEGGAASLQREAERLRAETREQRRAQRGRRRVTFTRAEPSEPIVVGAGNDRATGAAVAFRGMAIVTGPELGRRRWHRGQYMLTASADLRTTLIGLYTNVRENPLQAVPITLLGLLVLLLLPVAWTDFTMVGRMGRSIAEAVAALRDGAAALGKGDLGHRIAIRGNDDLWDTARHFNTMAEGLERARALEKERDRLESELELARRIQQRLLPEGPPDVPGLEIAGHSEPAREVGGDYYDHFDLGGGRVLLVIADVSGKGVPAALLMSGFRASLMSQDAHALGPERIAARVNEFLHRSVESGKFVTAFLGFLDAASGTLVYANAGHNPPALLRRDGRVDWLAAGGVVLGILPQFRFESGETTLEQGDLLALYTDGVTEGADATGELWGEERLVAALRRLSELPCADAGQALVREVRAYEGESGPADDITVLLARRVPVNRA